MANKLKVVILAAFIFLIPGRAAPGQEVINCLAAEVNNRPITLVDVNIVLTFGLYDENFLNASESPKTAVLEHLIDRKVVMVMVRDFRGIDKREVEDGLNKVKNRIGQEKFELIRKKYGLTESDLFPYIEEMIHFEKSLNLRLGRTASISQSEIEKYYQELYVPQRKARNEVVKSLDEARSEISDLINSRERARKIIDWLKSLREQVTIKVNDNCLK